MSKFYYLNKDHTTRRCTLEEWAAQYEEMAKTDTKHVGEDFIERKHISTVWLGMDHSYWGGRPKLFETMIFDNNFDDEYCDRYSTWDEAVEGHRKAIDWVINGCKDELS